MQPEVVIDGVDGAMRELVPRVVPLPAMDAVFDVAFSADGKSLYAVGRGVVLDWRVLAVESGRVVAWVVIGVLALLAMVMVWRAMRRRGRKGVLHCRGCWYEVEAMVASGAERCSECGLAFAKRRPVKGVGTMRRFVPAMVLGAMAIGLAVATFVPAVVDWARATAQARLGVSRWWAERLNAEGEVGNPVWRTSADILVELDPATGAKKRTIVAREGPSLSVLVVMPDGAHMLVLGSDVVLCVRLRDGRVVSKLKLNPGVRSESIARICQGFCDGGRTVLIDARYVETRQDVDEACLVMGWNPFDGTARTVLKGENWTFDRTRTYSAAEWTRGMVREWSWESEWLNLCQWSETGEPLRAIWYSPRAGLDDQGRRMPEGVDMRSGFRKRLRFDPKVDVSARMAIRRDGTAGYSTWDGLRGLAEFDPVTGESRWVVKLPADVVGLSGLSLAHGERWLLLESKEGGAIFDLDRKEWIAMCTKPATITYCFNVKIAPDARQAAAATATDPYLSGRVGWPTAGWPTAEVLIWETAELLGE